VDLGQGPANRVVHRHYQNMVEHVSLSFCVCSITCIQIVSDSISSSYHFAVLFVCSQQVFVPLCFLSYFVDVRVVCRVVSVVVAVNFLTQVVLWVTVVSAPTIECEGMQVRSEYFLTAALDVGVDAQSNEVVTQAVGEALCKNCCGVQTGLAAAHNPVVSFNWE